MSLPPSVDWACTIVAWLQVERSEAQMLYSAVRSEAEAAYNLSHANIVNTLSHEVKPVPQSAGGSSRTILKLYMVQVQPVSLHSTCLMCSLYVSPHTAATTATITADCPCIALICGTSHSSTCSQVV